MDLIIIYNDSYPHGRALTNRIHYYAKGLIENGVNVKILVHRPTEFSNGHGLNNKVEGVYEGVPYQYTAGRVFRADSFLERRKHDIKGILEAGRHIITPGKKAEAVLLVSGSLSHVLFYKAATLISGAKLLMEKSEIPFLFRKMTGLKKVYKFFYLHTVFKMFHGILVISDNLKDYLSALTSRKTNMQLIPILANKDDFLISSKPVKHNEFRVVYAGSLCQKKDGAIDLVKAFSLFVKNGAKAKLVIAGDTQSKEDKRNLLNTIEECNIKEKVELTGYLDRKKFVETLAGADLLAFAKPSSEAADFCFPTKLGEFLLTGKPVLATKVGVIPEYIEDGLNGFLAEPGNPADIAGKMKYVYEHYEAALETAKRGRRMAVRNFDYRDNAVRLKTFLNELVYKKPQKKLNEKFAGVTDER